MDNVVLALSVSIAVVLLLLLSCWKGDKKKSVRKSPANVQRAPARQSSSNQLSRTGTGVLNRRADERLDELSNLTGYDDYGQVAQYMSVEPEVYESHARYSSDMNRLTSGPSYMSERDDPNDVVPWVGLRKPKYQDVYAGDDSRQDHSESPDQMRKPSYYMIG